MCACAAAAEFGSSTRGGVSGGEKWGRAGVPPTLPPPAPVASTGPVGGDGIPPTPPAAACGSFIPPRSVGASARPTHGGSYANDGGGNDNELPPTASPSPGPTAGDARSRAWGDKGDVDTPPPSSLCCHSRLSTTSPYMSYRPTDGESPPRTSSSTLLTRPPPSSPSISRRGSAAVLAAVKARRLSGPPSSRGQPPRLLPQLLPPPSSPTPSLPASPASALAPPPSPPPLAAQSPPLAVDAAAVRQPPPSPPSPPPSPSTPPPPRRASRSPTPMSMTHAAAVGTPVLPTSTRTTPPPRHPDGDGAAAKNPMSFVPTASALRGGGVTGGCDQGVGRAGGGAARRGRTGRLLRWPRHHHGGRPLMLHSSCCWRYPFGQPPPCPGGHASSWQASR